jgi:hypothetical protein
MYSSSMPSVKCLKFRFAMRRGKVEVEVKVEVKVEVEV